MMADELNINKETIVKSSTKSHGRGRSAQRFTDEQKQRRLTSCQELCMGACREVPPPPECLERKSNTKKLKVFLKLFLYPEFSRAISIK
jgi:hypothetical protein